MREEMDMDFAEWLETQLILQGMESDQDSEREFDLFDDEQSYDPMDF